jgi:uncharacterized protein YuzE
MSSSHRLSLEIDQGAGAAYLRFGDGQVARSVEFTEDLIVDLDEHEMVLGIEILDLSRSVPLDQLTERFHIRTEAFTTLLQALRSSTTAHQVGTPTSAVATGSLTPQQVNNLSLA